VAAGRDFASVHAIFSTFSGIDTARKPFSGLSRGPTPDKRWNFCVQRPGFQAGRHKKPVRAAPSLRSGINAGNFLAVPGPGSGSGPENENQEIFVAATRNLASVHAIFSTFSGIDTARKPFSGRSRGPTPDKRWNFCVQHPDFQDGRHKKPIRAAPKGPPGLLRRCRLSKARLIRCYLSEYIQINIVRMKIIKINQLFLENPLTSVRTWCILQTVIEIREKGIPAIT
jgi:hypothetical protein